MRLWNLFRDLSCHSVRWWMYNQFVAMWRRCSLIHRYRNIDSKMERSDTVTLERLKSCKNRSWMPPSSIHRTAWHLDIWILAMTCHVNKEAIHPCPYYCHRQQYQAKFRLIWIKSVPPFPQKIFMNKLWNSSTGAVKP